MLVDCFMYAGEIECLQMRLRELRDIADKVHIIEACETFQGNRRQLSNIDINYVIDPRDRARIAYTTITSLGAAHASPWDREAYQRNYMEVVTRHLAPDDIVLMSDADEIPRRDVVKLLKSSGAPAQVVRLGGPHYLYAINVQQTSYGPWYGTYAVSRRYLDKHTPQEIRGFGMGNIDTGNCIPNSGWHFSFLGGRERILEKLYSWSHVEDGTYANDKNILDALQNVRDWKTDRNMHLERVTVDDTWPLYVRENPTIAEQWCLLDNGVAL